MKVNTHYYKYDTISSSDLRVKVNDSIQSPVLSTIHNSDFLHKEFPFGH